MLNYRTKLLLKQSFPIFINQELINIGSVIDTIILGHLAVLQIAAFGIGSNVFLLISIPIVGMLFALIPLMSQKYGANNYNDVVGYFANGIWLAVFLSFVGIIFLIYPNWILSISDTVVNSRQMVNYYLLTMIINLPALLLSRVFFAFFVATLKPTIIMWVSLIIIPFKLILNYIFIVFILTEKYGVIGCGLVTGIVNWLNVVLMICILCRSEYKVFNFSQTVFSFNLRKQIEILKIGIPIAITFIIDYTFFTITALLIARINNIAVSANQIVNSICYIVYLIPLSVGTAATSLVARELGQDNIFEAKLMGFKAIKVAFVVGLVVATAFLLMHESIANLYTNDTQVVEIVNILIMMAAIYYVFDALLTVISGILRGYQKTVIPTIIMGLAFWGIGLLGGYLITLKFNFPIFVNSPSGFWLFLIIASAIALMFMALYYKKTVINSFVKKDI